MTLEQVPAVQTVPIEAVLEDAGLKKEDMAFTLATGYGRTSLMDGIADKQMSELSCHAKGAYFLFPKVHTVIDIGGQDVKVLRVEDGVMTNFQMNVSVQPEPEDSWMLWLAFSKLR